MSLFDPIYTAVIRPTLFRVDPERVHDWIMHALPFSRKQEIWGYPFENPLGLAGGFDKNAECVDLWDMFGFAFIELGTITPHPQPGNPKPRLFRYPEKKAIINRMGFNNDGANAIANRLQDFENQDRRYPGITGISIGKQFSTPVEEMDKVIDDYVTSVETLYRYADYFAVNVSSPNTKNLRTLQQVDSLEKLLSALLDKLSDMAETNRKPLCVKFAPDLSNDEIKAAVEMAMKRGVDGIIATNTTNQTGELEQGGLSGIPLRERATEVIQLIHQQTGGTLPIIGCGGIFTAEDAIEKLQAGAWLLQIYTGFVYQGPSCVKTICDGIIKAMNQRNLTHLAQFR